MCGRYFVSDEMEQEIRKILRQIEREGKTDRTLASVSAKSISFRDVRPSEQALVLAGEPRGGICPQTMTWGFPNPMGSGLLINARAETAQEKRTFQESVRARRCAIPAAGFYEWDKDKNKVTFFRDGDRATWLAGFYHLIDNALRFIILTTAANASMEPVHDRMPLLLEPEQIDEWIGNDGRLDEFLSMPMPELMRRQEYEQMAFF